MEIIWTAEAERDMKAVERWFMRHSAEAAERQLQAITDRVKILVIFPDAGRSMPEFSNPRLRELIEADYRIMYERFVDRVEVFAVINGRQSFLPESRQD